MLSSVEHRRSQGIGAGRCPGYDHSNNFSTIHHAGGQKASFKLTGTHCTLDASNASIDGMGTLTIRRLDEKIKTRLRVRAAHHGRSMEEEAREILRSALVTTPSVTENLADVIRRRVAEIGGMELELPRRDAMREPPEFGE